MVTRVQVRGIAHGGAGVAAAVSGVSPEDRRVWFVRGAMPGELVEAEAELEHRRYVQARAVRVLAPSPARVSPPCASAAECGGCDWQHVDPAAQVELLRRIVVDQLRRYALPAEIDLSPAVRSLGYRRRVRFHYVQGEAARTRGQGQAFALGLRRARAHDIVDLRQCIVLEPALDAALQRVRELARHLPREGEVHAITDGAAVVLGLDRLDLRRADALVEDCASLIDDRLVGFELRGDGRRIAVGTDILRLDAVVGTHDEPALPAVEVGPFSFAQASTDGNTQLVSRVVDWADPRGRRRLELHAGAGTFTRSVVAIESSTEATASLRRMALRWELPIDVRCEDASTALQRLAQRRERFAVVVADPPRVGMGLDAARALAAIATSRVVLVSCDPATLARDLAPLVDDGLRIRRMAVHAMMPMTAEVETVVLLERDAPREETDA
jgi:23S rRNA (uracil1939-C5)-methyltransferase